MNDEKFEADLHDAMASLNRASKNVKQTLRNLKHIDWPVNHPDTAEVELRAKRPTRRRPAWPYRRPLRRLNLKNDADHSDKAVDAVLQTLALAAGFFGIMFSGGKKK